MFDKAIPAQGYEQDGDVSTAVCCTLASEEKQGRLSIRIILLSTPANNLYFSQFF
jgi:hypothetical protein